MTETISTNTVTFAQYKDSAESAEIRIFVSGFEPTYDPIICTKGQPRTMKDLVKKLENLLAVEITITEKGALA